MKLLTYQYQGENRSGALIDKGLVIDLNRAYKVLLRHRRQDDELIVANSRVPTDIINLLQGGETSLQAARESVALLQEQLETNHFEPLITTGLAYPIDQISICPPVLRPGKVLGLSLNYRCHAAEWGKTPPTYPLFFHKTANSLTGHNQPISLPLIHAQIDMEAELAIIIGKRGQYIPEAQAFSHIAGYACANDINAHTLEGRTEPWMEGVMFDTFCPLGPVLVTRDEVANPHALNIKSYLNGQLMQNANTADMHFKVSQIITYLSSRVTLEPGDVILTGTPAGIGRFQRPPRFLQNQDIVTVAIEKLGQLTNTVFSP